MRNCQISFKLRQRESLVPLDTFITAMALPRVVALTYSTVRNIQPNEFDTIISSASFPSLTSLSLPASSFLLGSDQILRLCERGTSIQSLSFEGAWISLRAIMESLQHLDRLTALTHINIQDLWSVRPAGEIFVPPFFSRLCSLHIQGTSTLIDVLQSALSSPLLAQLTQLTLESVNGGESGGIVYSIISLTSAHSHFDVATPPARSSRD